MRTFKAYFFSNSFESRFGYFPEKTQSKLYWFFFFLGFPALEILGNSITFYLFILIILEVKNFGKFNFLGKKIFIILLISIFISTIFAPFLERSPGIISKFTLLIQYSYWILLVFFLIQYKNKINIVQLSKYLTYSIAISSFFYFVFPLEIESSLISIKLGQERNAFVFNLLCVAPLTFFYLREKGGILLCLITMLIYIIVMMSTNGRSGSILILFEMSVVLSMLTQRMLSIIRFFTLILLLTFTATESDIFQPVLFQLAENVKEINPRLSGFILEEGDGSLERDKSWGQRKLMIEKGFEIFKEYPVFGIGANNFKYYDAELSAHASSQFYYLVQTKDWYNGRSAHNSYIQILAEFGIIGLSLFILILAFPLFYFVKKFIFSQLTFNDIAIVSLLSMTVYFYAISSFTGAIPWVIIGLSWYQIHQNTKIRL